MTIMENFKLAMEIMGMGMAGIFVVIAVLMLSVYLLGKIPDKTKPDDIREE